MYIHPQCMYSHVAIFYQNQCCYVENSNSPQLSDWGSSSVYCPLQRGIGVVSSLKRTPAQVGVISPSMTTRQPYQGSRLKLCLAFDIGATYSGISYCVLRPGKIPTVYSVTRFVAIYPLKWTPQWQFARFSGRKPDGRSSKVPSVLYYDQSGQLRAVGSETTSSEILKQAREEAWLKVTWYVPVYYCTWRTASLIPCSKGSSFC